MTDEEPTFAFCRVEGIEVVQVPDGYVVYDDARHVVHYLNPSAAALFELITVCPDVKTVARQIRDLFSLERSPDADVAVGLQELISQGLIQRIGFPEHSL